MKKFRMILGMVAVGSAMALSSCEKDPDPVDPVVTEDAVLKGSITANKTLTADKIWTLSGRVFVESGATLTINPGTIIKAAGGTGENASVLIIAQGAKIMAEGTVDKPIVMTSVADDIKLNEKFGSNLNASSIKGLWGGLIVLGKAPISPKTGDKAQIEGIPADVASGAYGGTDVADNSGVIKFLSIRFGGALIGEGNEINGLTLGGVGNQTVIENVEIVGNIDDGIEFFGGSVNVKNAIVMYQGDDGYDVDQAYSGTLDNFMYIAGADSDHALEIDGPEGSANNTGSFTFKNGVLKGAVGEYADFRDGARGTVQDCYFFGFDAAADLELDDDVSSANYISGALKFSGLVFNPPAGVTLATISQDKAPMKNVNFATAFALNNSIGTTKPAGFNKAAFTGWSLASHLDLLSDF
jgi:hypothetical protein